VNVLILTQFYPPEPCAASNRTAAMAHKLREAGHRVHVLTGFPNFPSGRIPAAYRGKVRALESDSGVRVTRLWTFSSTHRSSRNRLLNWASVAASACLYQLFLRNIDVVYVTSPPITLALPAAVAKWRHRACLIVDIRDSYPEVAVRMGMWSPNGSLARTVGHIARWLYRLADTIVCVTRSVGDEIAARGAGWAKIVVAPNGFDRVDVASAHPFSPPEGSFVAAFVGNIGLAAGVDVILDAAVELRAATNVHFAIVGDGSEYARLKRRAEDERLTNVHFLGVLPRVAAMAVLRDADVCVVPLRRNIADSLPTKMFDALSVGCPLLVCADGEARRFVEESGGGWSVAPEEPRALASRIESIVDAADERAARARSGRDYVERHYDRDRNVDRVVRYIERICKSPARPTGVESANLDAT
jgi:glycosyltransferase involved in cell wall biosynthesis